MSPGSVRSGWLAPGLTLLRAVVGMIPPGKTEINPKTNAIQSLVVVTQDGQPRIALLQNTPAAFHERPEMVEALTAELTEVVRSGGQPVADDQAASHRATCR